KNIDAEIIKELKNDLFRALVEADVNIDIAAALTSEVEKRALSIDIPGTLSREKLVVSIVYEELTKIMGSKAYPITVVSGRPTILLLVGIQGSGKTTTVAKLAKYFKRTRKKVGVICADNWRPGAYDQLSQLSERIEVDIYGEPDNDNPIKIAEKGIKQFTQEKKDIIIVDTAGRHQEEKALIEEMKKLTKKVKADEIILVIDGTLGQTAYSQAQAFSKATNIGAIIVTKLDGSAKGGGAISASAATGAPIKFIGTGEDVDGLETFNPEGFVSRILGRGDLETLLQEVKKAEMPTEESAMAMMKGKFTLRDMMSMFESMKSMGSLGKIMDLIPGMKYNVTDEMLDVSKENMDKFEVILKSMTEDELDGDVKLRRSRIERIAKGSGTTIEDVRVLMNQYTQSKKMMKGMLKGGRRRGGMPGLPPGFPPMG
ncbi:MAG: signal recognition particle protein, partial [Candidatus Heimdallarchaeota archaeon]|nr:signal recognition particle protein [Candidatus Heimdallarchaeota archaeon]MCK5049990.1 signal recognition particle protein [Candidatus Heimdallarchaeota archaeon]